MTVLQFKALVLAVFAHLHPGAERTVDSRVVDAIATVGAEAGTTLEEVSLLTTYAWLESGGQVSPKPYSWDAKAGRSCGPWQEPCAFTKTASVTAQARYWLSCVRQAGLASVDSSKPRAEQRTALARRALNEALPAE